MESFGKCCDLIWKLIIDKLSVLHDLNNFQLGAKFSSGGKILGIVFTRIEDPNSTQEDLVGTLKSRDIELGRICLADLVEIC